MPPPVHLGSYWDMEHYPMVEKIFRQSAEFCSEHEVWVLNVAHVFFLQAPAILGRWHAILGMWHAIYWGRWHVILGMWHAIYWGRWYAILGRLHAGLGPGLFPGVEARRPHMGVRPSRDPHVTPMRPLT
eukprot:342332-Prymnesium_polylepis.3